MRTAALLSMLAYAPMAFLPTWSLAQSPPCSYDRNAPSLESARRNFKTLNYKCAEAELNDLLKNKNLTLEEKSNAHILMVAVYHLSRSSDQQYKSTDHDSN